MTHGVNCHQLKQVACRCDCSRDLVQLNVRQVDDCPGPDVQSRVVISMRREPTLKALEGFTFPVAATLTPALAARAARILRINGDHLNTGAPALCTR